MANTHESLTKHDSVLNVNQSANLYIHNFDVAMMFFPIKLRWCLRKISLRVMCKHIWLNTVAILPEVTLVVDGHRLWLMVLRGIGWNWYIEKSLYSFSHNHASGKWLYLKGRYYWRYTHFWLPWLWEEVECVPLLENPHPWNVDVDVFFVFSLFPHPFHEALKAIRKPGKFCVRKLSQRPKKNSTIKNTRSALGIEIEMQILYSKLKIQQLEPKNWWIIGSMLNLLFLKRRYIFSGEPAVSFQGLVSSPKLTAKDPENWWLEDDLFLLGYHFFKCYMGVSKNRGKTTKMDGENNGKPS